jgi:ribonuclease Z
MLEIVFLGTGSGIPSKSRNPPAIWLQYGPDCMLWDCGEGTQRQLMTAGLSFMKISNIFITHWHADHWAGLIGLMQTMNMEGRKEPLRIYGPDAERFIGDILDLDYWGPRFRIEGINVPHEGSAATKVIETGEYEVLSAPAEHTVPSVGYAFVEKDKWNVDIAKAERLYGLGQSPLIGRLKEKGSIVHKGRTIRLEEVGLRRRGIKAVYTGDTRVCASIESLSRGADVLIHDSTFLDEDEGMMHTDVRSACLMAKKAEVRNLVLTHFSRRYVDPRPLLDEAVKHFPGTRLARDFLRVTIRPVAGGEADVSFKYR